MRISDWSSDVCSSDLLDLKQALADADLRKVTGMCELAGIDVAFPFLDDELVAFCATIPPELQLKDGRLRAFFKEAFRDFLPEEVIAKKKHGFGMPFYEWTRDHPRLRQRSEERRVGKECVSTGRSRWSQNH